MPGFTGYSASKAGLLGLVRSLAAELAGENVQVNAICPGWVETDMARQGIQAIVEATGMTHEEAVADVLKAVPLGRMGEPADIAGTVAWLLTDAHGITGQAIDQNGGAGRAREGLPAERPSPAARSQSRSDTCPSRPRCLLPSAPAPPPCPSDWAP